MTYEHIPVFILAGGFGRRLSKEVPYLPKPIAPIAGRPFLEWLLLWLAKQNFTEIILLTGYKHEAIFSSFGNGSSHGLNIRYSIEDTPLGTGGAVIKALQLVSSAKFIVINGDTYFDIDLHKLLTFHDSINIPNCSIALNHVRDTSRYGTVKCTSNGQITGFIEKGSSGIREDHYINGGIYIFSSQILTQFSCSYLSMENDIFPYLLSKKQLFGLGFNANFIDIGIPEDYHKANTLLPLWQTA